MTNKIFGYSWEEISNIQQRKVVSNPINTTSTKDYGCDPMGDGKFKMVPSGDIVDFDERNRRLELKQ